jgi:hypothetical protein
MQGTSLAGAPGACSVRLADMWLVQVCRNDDFGRAVEQLTRLWVNALRLDPEPGQP